MYYEKTYRFGQYKEVHKYSAHRQKPGERRERKDAGTSDEMVRYNQKQRAKKVQRLILGNFRKGDWHLTLSYRKEERPEKMEEAKEDLTKALRMLKREYRKAGAELKYIRVTERGRLGACHHHIVVNNVPGVTDRAVQEVWKKGHLDFSPLYNEGEYKKLSEYIVKKETKEEEEGCTYSCSRNLIRPVEKVKEIGAGTWSERIRVPEGWELVEDSVENGTNPYNGKRFQTYMLKKRRMRT